MRIPDPRRLSPRRAARLLCASALFLAGARSARPAEAGELKSDEEFVVSLKQRVVSPPDLHFHSVDAQEDRERFDAAMANGLQPPDLRVDAFLQKRGYFPCDPAAAGSAAVNRRYYDNRGVGVVLSGGVSKGLAHIGVLKELDRLGIRIDGITGASMGAIVGALYAAGYSPTQIHDLVHEEIDWDTVFTDDPPLYRLPNGELRLWGTGSESDRLPRVYQEGFKSGQNIYVLLDRYLYPGMASSGNCFDNLYVPFRAIATDVLAADDAVISNGSLATAVRASQSFPVLFTPTFMNGRRYIDGGVLDNYPLSKTVDISTGITDILGFNVSDESVENIGEKNPLPFFSFIGAGRALIDGFGTAVRSSIKHQKRSFRQANAGGERPRNLHSIDIPLTGGFADFAPYQIDGFIERGRGYVLRLFCRELMPLDADCALIEHEDLIAEDLRERIEAKLESRIDPDWRYRVNDGLLSKESVEELNGLRWDRRGVGEALDGFAAALKDRARVSTAPWTDADRTDDGRETSQRPGAWDRHRSRTGENILQGFAVRFPLNSAGEPRADFALDESYGRRLGGKPGGLEPLRRDALILLEIIADATAGGDGRRRKLKDMSDYSQIEAVFRRDEIVLRFYGWEHRVDRLEFDTDLTEQGAPGEASILQWDRDGGAAPADGARIAELESSLPRCRMLAEAPNCRFSTVVNDSADPSGRRRRIQVVSRRLLPVTASQYDLGCASDTWAAPVAGPGYRKSGQDLWRWQFLETFPAVYVTTSPSFQTSLQNLLERYYSLGHVEYARLERLGRGEAAFSEKTNTGTWGTFYLNYRYDTEDGHAYLARNSVFLDRFNLMSDVGIANPYEQTKTGYYAGTNISFFNSIPTFGGERSSQPLFSSARLAPFWSRKLLSFGGPEDDPGRLTYRQWGAKLVVDLPENYFIAGGYSRYADVDPSRFPRAVPVLRNAAAASTLQEADFTVGFNFGGIGGLAGKSNDRLKLEDARLQYTHSENLSGARSSQWFVSERARIDHPMDAPPEKTAPWFDRARFLLDDPLELNARIEMGGISGPITSFDSLYSLGGYFPLMGNEFSYKKRADFIGSGLNEHWGKDLFDVEYALSLLRWEGLLHKLNQGTKTQLDLVYDLGSVDYSAFYSGLGLSLSAYLPVVSTLQPKFNFAVGTETPLFSRGVFDASVNILF